MLRYCIGLAVFTTSFLQPDLSCPTAQAGPAVVRATFDVRLGPLQVGRGNFEAQITERYYAVGVSAKVTGVARLLAGGEGSATSRGAFLRDKLTPTLYHISNSAGSGSNEVRLLMKANHVVNETVVPPSPPAGDRVPLNEAARRNVVDPLSAFVFPVAGDGPLVAPSSCDRTLNVFDGRQRYDITLSYSRILSSVHVGDYEGPMLVCKARYTPIAGHRKIVAAKEDSSEVYSDMEAWMMPINGTRAMVLYRMQIGTAAGTLSIQAAKVSIQPGDASPSDATASTE